MSTYKTNDAGALQAWHDRLRQIEELRADAKVFAERWGADPNFVAQSSASLGYQVAGFVFKPVKDTLLWTVPDREMQGAQRPRRTLRKVTKEQRAKHAEIKRDWDATFPKQTVSMGPLLESVGLDWGMLFLTGYEMFEHDGWLWLKTGAGPKAEHLVEILVSEFDAAHAACRA